MRTTGKIITTAIVGIIALTGMCGCGKIRERRWWVPVAPDIPVEVNLKVSREEPGITAGKTPREGLRYKTFQRFDMPTLKGEMPVADTPFVYVRQTDNLIVVRRSDDVGHPYVIRKHGDYWHCKWWSDERGDSLVVDRFIKNRTVYEYIQRMEPDGNVSRRLRENDHNGKILGDALQVYDVNYDFGKAERFEYSVGEKLDSLLIRLPAYYPLKDNGKPDSSIYYSSNSFLYRNTEKKHNALRYLMNRTIHEISYSFPPLGIYDDRQDIRRLDVIKRIK